MEFIAGKCHLCNKIGVPYSQLYFCVDHHPYCLCKHDCNNLGKLCEPIRLFDNLYFHKGFDCGNHIVSNKKIINNNTCEDMDISSSVFYKDAI